MSNKKIVRKDTVTYIVDGGLYINLTNKCTNNCDFCIRNNGDGAYGSESLWLTTEPSYEKIIDSVFARNLSDFKEIVFCGYGEPSERLPVAVKVAEEIKRRMPSMKIRINTNGQSDLIFDRDTSRDYAVFDSVSISLNASTREKYQKICHSRFGEKSFDAILKFANNVNNYVQDVAFSVVKEALTDEELAECFKIAENVGVRLRVRDLIT